MREGVAAVLPIALIVMVLCFTVTPIPTDLMLAFVIGTVMLPFAMGACEAVGGNILTDAFGLVSLVAMMPLITIQIMGAVYVYKTRRTGQVLDLYGLQATEKAVVTSVADAEKPRQIMRSAKRKLFIDIPGNGVMMAVPVKSVGGGRTLAYLTDNTTPEGGVPQMQFDHELLVVILNQSYMDDVMNAARSAGAFGGTVLHAKGTGAKYAEKFFGVSLANEKEVILIAAGSREKNAIMRAIMEQTGPHTPAGAITFSLPISSVAGLRSVDKD